MALSLWNTKFVHPFDLMNRDINDLWNLQGENESKRSVIGFNPKLDVTESDGALHFHMELPGVRKEDIDVHFEDGQLTISGVKKSSREEKTDKRHVVERQMGKFSRSMTLGEHVSEKDFSVKFVDGLLDIEVKKPTEPKKKKVKLSIE